MWLASERLLGQLDPGWNLTIGRRSQFLLVLGHEAHPKTTLYGVVFQKIEWAPAYRSAADATPLARPELVGAMILLAMTFAAAVTASRRAQGIRGSLLLSFYAIAAGAGVVIAAMLATGTLTTDISVLVPVGSMILANAMNACAQSVERFRAEVTAHVGNIEAGLALGAVPAVAAAPYFQSAVYASLPTC